MYKAQRSNAGHATCSAAGLVCSSSSHTDRQTDIQAYHVKDPPGVAPSIPVAETGRTASGELTGN